MYEPAAHLTTPSTEIKPKDQISPPLTTRIKQFYPTLCLRLRAELEFLGLSVKGAEALGCSACQGKHTELGRRL